MRHTITQEDSMGCGAACVAFATSTSYSKAVSILGQDKAKSVGFQLKDIVHALSQLGYIYQFKHVKPKMKQAIYKNGAIVFIKRSTKYPYGHYLIRHGDSWADPWINLVLDKNIVHAKSGYRKRLPGQAQWVILPTGSEQ